MATSALWIDKYKPKTIKDLIGCGAVCNNLVQWLVRWDPKISKRGAVVYGAPGIGKSVLVEIACAEAKIPNFLTLNSSNKRTAKALKQFSEAFGTRKVDAYMTGKMQRSKPGAIIVEDMDSMVSGGSDFRGVTQIVSFLKTTAVPVICVLNDNNNREFSSLVSACEQYRVGRPSPDQIVPLLMRVAKTENVRPPLQIATARTLACSCGCDVRQCLMELQYASVGSGSLIMPNCEGGFITMDRPMGLFEILPTIFRAPFPRQTTPLLQSACAGDEKMTPMLVQENYLDAAQKNFDTFASAADAMSLGDIVEGMSRRTSCAGGEWGAVRAIVGVALPCSILGSPLNGRARFPAFFGKTSTAVKACNDMKLLAHHLGPLYSRQTLALQQVGHLSQILVGPLEGAVGAAMSHVAVVARLKALKLGKSDWDLIADLGRMLPAHKPILPATKSALTKALGAAPRKPRAKGAPPAKRLKLQTDDEDSPEGADDEPL